MKPVETDREAEIDPPPCSAVGDPIGSTVYSERFVLRLLLKLSDLPGDEATLEEDLCILWDMTAERDVVDFLLQHHFLEFVRYAWPRVPSARLTEIFLGVVANMCCCEAAVRELRAATDFCSTIVQLVHSDDTLLLVQVLRVINACLYGLDAEEATRWLTTFATTDFPPALAFILTNSSNKELLATALETLNVICCACNVDVSRTQFFKQFVTYEMIGGVHECVEELAIVQRDSCERHELERVFLVSLEVSMNLAGFETSPDLYEDRKDKVCAMMAAILQYYKVKTVEDKEVDLDLIEVVDSINSISDQLGLHADGDTEKCVMLTHEMWAALRATTRPSRGEPTFEDTADDATAFVENLNKPMGSFICRYMESCPEEFLERALSVIGEELDVMLSLVADENVRRSITQRTSTYRSRLKENVEC